jgi:proliferating cell nuclear antigen
MFKTQVKFDALKEIASIAKTIVKELRIDFSEDGISVTAVDGAHVGMVNLKYQKSVFSNFSGEATSFAVDLDRFTAALKFGKSGQLVGMSIGEDGKLELVTGTVNRKNSLQDMESFNEIPPMPNINLPAFAVLKSEDFIQGVKAGGDVSDELSFELSQQGMVMQSNGTLDTVTVKISKEKFSKFDIPDSIKSAYPLKMLSDFINSISSEQIVVFAGDYMPMRIDFDLCAGIGKGKFLIAPRTPDTVK